MVKGEGSTPVILAPKEPAIDWSLYEAVEIRMSAAGGSEVKIRIGDFEVKQKLGPPNQYQVYRFEVKLDAPKGTRPLAIMPTDSLSDLVAIRSIKLLPRAESFPGPSGRQSIGKRDEYRSSLYVHAPASVSFRVTPGTKCPPSLWNGGDGKRRSHQIPSSGRGSQGRFVFADFERSGFVDRCGCRFIRRLPDGTVKLSLISESGREGAVALMGKSADYRCAGEPSAQCTHLPD